MGHSTRDVIVALETGLQAQFRESNQACTICLEDFAGNTYQDIVVTPCGHVFHRECHGQMLLQRLSDTVHDYKYGTCCNCRALLSWPEPLAMALLTNFITESCGLTPS